MDSTAKEIQELKQRLTELEAFQSGGTSAMDRELIERELKLIDDPFKRQNPFDVQGTIPPDADFPEGQAVTWLNPKVREQLGMNGWEYMRWGDFYVGEKGEKLKGIIPDLPALMAGQDRQDSLVRRQDMILGRLDKRLWDSRQTWRELESARQLSSLKEETRARLQSKHRELKVIDVKPEGQEVSTELAPVSHRKGGKGSGKHAFSLMPDGVKNKEK